MIHYCRHSLHPPKCTTLWITLKTVDNIKKRKSAPMRIPKEEASEILKQKIRDLRRLRYNYNEISEMLAISKTKISFVLKGRRANIKK